LQDKKNIAVHIFFTDRFLFDLFCRRPADVPAGMAAGTKMVCESEQSIGFRWIKGNWKSTDFVPGRYIVEKLAKAGNGKAA